MDMEDLDALLADLQATPTAKPTVYSKSVNSDRAEGASNQKVSPSGSPPPIPPAPSAYTPLPDYSKLKSRPPATMPKPSKAGAADVAPSFSEGLADHVNNNMSELDGLLSELDNSVDGRVLPVHSPGGAFTNGDARGGSSTSHSSLSDHSNVMGKPAAPYTSTVDALIDELGSVVQHPLQLRPTTGRALLSDPPSMRTASSATRELDELMASLSDFKVNVQKATDTVDGKPVPDHAPAKVPAPDEERARLDKTERQAPVKQPPAKQQPARAHITPVQPLESFGAPPSANLDSMLGSLQSNMSKQGVTTVTKGTCAACNKPIIGQVCTALGRTWHPEHFCCDVCDVALGTKTFFERDGRPYCEKDYHEKFAPRCFGCDGPILDACVTSLDHTWHPEHFVCSECGKPFGDAGFHEKDGKAFCRDDYFKMFAPKCSGCNSAIIDNYISALSGHWHPQCFVCMECRQPFQGGSFFEHEGMPYCEMHYHARRGSLCYSCQKPITGRCITAMHRKFHPEHFICAFCLKQLNKGTFKEQNDKPYCHPCFVKLFG